VSAKLLALRGLFANGIVHVAGSKFDCADDVAAELLSSGKAVPADDATRKRLKARSCTWAEATPEAASQRPWAMRGR
jgi:hypothetical protein